MKLPLIRVCPHGSRRACATIFAGAALVFGASSAVQAQGIYWNAASGDWATVGNWANGSQGGSALTSFATDGSTDYFLTNGTLGSAKTTTITNAPTGRYPANLTIGAYNSLFIAGTASTGSAGSPRVKTNFTNAGLIEAGSAGTDSTRLEIAFSAGGASVNTGTIAANKGLFSMVIGTGSLNNTGGLLVSRNGATLNLANNQTAPAAIQNGTLRSETGGTIQVGVTDIQNKLRLDGVTVDNQGTFTTIQSFATAASGARTVTTFLNGSTAFTNAANATVNVLNSGSGSATGDTVTQLAASFEINNTASFNNQGLLNITNSTTRTGAALTNNSLVFSVNSATASFQNTGTIQVVNASTSTGATAVFTSVKSIVNEGTVRVQGTASKTASFTVSGSGASYTQSGTGVRTLLEQGGVLSAENVHIDSGKLGGVGTVTGIDTYIGAGGRLVAGDTLSGGVGAGVLSVNSFLTFEDNATAVFALGANTATSGRVVMGTSFDLTIGNMVKISLLDLNGTATAGVTYRLFELAGGTVTGSFVLDPLPSGWVGSLTTGSNYVDFTLTSLSAVPEPSSTALLASVAIAMTVLAQRRRRSDRVVK